MVVLKPGCVTLLPTRGGKEGPRSSELIRESEEMRGARTSQHPEPSLDWPKPHPRALAAEPSGAAVAPSLTLTVLWRHLSSAAPSLAAVSSKGRAGQCSEENVALL